MGGGGGFSYLELILHSWLKTIFLRKDWIWVEHYVKMVDGLKFEKNRGYQLLNSPDTAYTSLE
ncbi:hypothetical protein BDF14DRAFT_1785477 [Spinellus fusiger]|nr:hypothetical protein BDF14DRAFT_1785477 [Spinellus fusiger]